MSSKSSSVLWDWLTFAGLVLIVFHLLALWYRWLRPDPDFLAFSTGVIQLLAIASFLGLQTEGGKKLVLRLDNTLGLGKWVKSPARLCATVWALSGLVAILLYLGAPLAAQLYRQRGADAFEDGNNSQAIRHFKQALSLAPGSARTHYNLGNAYEQLYDYDLAIDEYQKALEMDDSFWPAYNNLGRLYLIARSDADAALATMLTGERRVEDALSKAVMAKNLAWAYSAKGLNGTAVEKLQTAIDDLQALRSNGDSVEIYQAEAYLLLARIIQAQGDAEAARGAFQDSLGYALAVVESPICTAQGPRLPPDCLNATRWAAEAREALAEAR
jgi:tetratricopeptide (TPR) repeat protein